MRWRNDTGSCVSDAIHRSDTIYRTGEREETRRKREGRDKKDRRKREGREKKEIRQTEGKRRKGCG